jgi:hypothetical protein
MKYVAWLVIVLFFPVVVLGFLVEAVIESFAIGRLLFVLLREHE